MTPFDTNITGESGKGKENRKKKCKKKGDLMEKRKKTKWFAAVGSLFLMVLMLSTSVFAAESSGLVYGSGTITRAEWLHDLVTVFDMTVEDDNLPGSLLSGFDIGQGILPRYDGRSRIRNH